MSEAAAIGNAEEEERREGRGTRELPERRTGFCRGRSSCWYGSRRGSREGNGAGGPSVDGCHIAAHTRRQGPAAGENDGCAVAEEALRGNGERHGLAGGDSEWVGRRCDCEIGGTHYDRGRRGRAYTLPVGIAGINGSHHVRALWERGRQSGEQRRRVEGRNGLMQSEGRHRRSIQRVVELNGPGGSWDTGGRERAGEESADASHRSHGRIAGNRLDGQHRCGLRHRHRSGDAVGAGKGAVSAIGCVDRLRPNGVPYYRAGSLASGERYLRGKLTETGIQSDGTGRTRDILLRGGDRSGVLRLLAKPEGACAQAQ